MTCGFTYASGQIGESEAELVHLLGSHILVAEEDDATLGDCG